MITFSTSLGDIKIKLHEDSAPETCANFKQYVADGHYDGTLFHRVIPGFMIQGGGFSSGMQQKPTRAPIKNEADNGLKNVRGSLSMARTSDPHSATSQFFLNVVDNAFLDFTAPNPNGWGYAVFADVVEGMDVADQIVAVPTGSVGHHGDVPLEEVLIVTATVDD